MANGINDILSVYRQSLASERQARLSEMQIALQGLQFEAQQKFREEGRAREDALGALQFAQTSALEAITNDAQMVYSRIASNPHIVGADYDEDSGALKGTNKIIKKLVKDGFTESDATQMVSIANTYGMAGKNPALASSAQEMAVQFGTRVARDYDIWKRSGFAKSTKQNQVKSPLISAMEKSGMMYSGTDNLQREQSADVFMGVAQGSQLMENIKNERAQMGTGDYTIDSPITMEEISAQVGAGTTDTDTGAIDFNALADEAGVSLGLAPPADATDDALQVNIQDTVKAEIESGEAAGGTLQSLVGQSWGVDYVGDEKIMESIDFLADDDKAKIQADLDRINDAIATKSAKVDSLYGERDEIISEYRVMEQQAQTAEDKYNYLFKTSNDREAVKKAARESVQAKKRLSAYGNPNDKDRAVAMEFFQSEGGKQRGAGGRTRLAGSPYQNTITNEIMSLSKEIEDLAKQKRQYGNF